MSCVSGKEQVVEMKHMLHVEFSVRDPETDRYVTFTSAVQQAGLKDFFARVALGIEHIFDTAAAPVMVHLTGPPVNKIAAIKRLRDLTGCDLLTAKNKVEGCGTLLVCENGHDARAVVDGFAMDGITVDVVPFNGDQSHGDTYLRLRQQP